MVLDTARVNGERFAEAYLRGYRKLMAIELQRRSVPLEKAVGYLPLLHGQVGVDISLSVLCTQLGTWFVWAQIASGRYIEAGEAEGFTEDWVTYTPYEDQRARALELLGFPQDVPILAARYFSSPALLCRETTIQALDRNGEDAGRDEARQHMYHLLESLQRDELTNRWETAVAKIHRAMDNAGTGRAGYEFQHGLQEGLEIAGCEPRDVSVQGEQIDASAWIESTPVLVEMMNSSAKADAKEVRDLYGKLARRPAGVVGILCVPAGFTADAVTIARGYAGTRAILLWDRKDLEHFLRSPDSVKEFFRKRYREFIDRAGQ